MITVAYNRMGFVGAGSAKRVSLIVLHPTWSVSVGFVRLLLSSRVSGSPSWGSSLPTCLAQDLCFLLSHISHFWGSISVLLFFLFLFMVWFEFLVHPCICVNHKFKNNSFKFNAMSKKPQSSLETYKHTRLIADLVSYLILQQSSEELADSFYR